MSTTVYIGADLHKRSSTWVGLDPDGNEVLHKRCPCDVASIETLIARLPAPAQEIEVALEPVCGWRWISECLEDHGVRVQPANPKRLYEIARSHTKTDRRDARTLANLLRTGYLPPAYKAPKEVQALRRAVRHRDALVSHATATKCRLQALCTADGAHNTTPRPGTNTGREIIMHHRGELPEHAELYEVIDALQPYIAAAGERISERVSADPELAATVSLLETMPGVGEVTAAAIVAEVGRFDRFPSPKQLVSYAGLNPIVRASGEKRGTFQLSKHGSRVLRAAIINAATRVRDKEGSRNLYAYYERMLTTGGKSRLEARVALAHKMLTIMWYMVTRNVAYNDQALQPAQSGVTPNTFPGA
jgi:transposase